MPGKQTGIQGGLESKTQPLIILLSDTRRRAALASLAAMAAGKAGMAHTTLASANGWQWCSAQLACAARSGKCSVGATTSRQRYMRNRGCRLRLLLKLPTQLKRTCPRQVVWCFLVKFSPPTLRHQHSASMAAAQQAKDAG